ncbi:MAG: putative F420-dependent oxidoreductase [Gammaproteobacteria bacterium]|jgi:probable F420-dependent oxidoreductase
MDFGKFGVFMYADALGPVEIAESAQRIEKLGYTTLWYPEAFNYEALALGGYLLSHTKKLIVASGIANIYARDAAASVMGLNTLNALYGGRFVLGLGVSHAPLVSDLRGHEYKKPVATMRSYLDVMDKTWAALGNTPDEKQVILAALGPNMLKLGGERSLGVMPANVTAGHAATAREKVGGNRSVCPMAHVCLSSDPQQARAAARAALKLYMTLPNYTNAWASFGFDGSDLENGGSDRLIDALVFWGDINQVKARLQDNFDQGADHIAIDPIRADGEAGLDWDLLEALAPAG